MIARIRSLPVLLVVALVCWAVPVAAQSPLRVGVADEAAGWRPVVRVQGLMNDRGLREAVESGLPLRIHVRVELWRKALFDQLVEAEDLSLAIVQDPIDRSYTIENGRTERRVATLADTDEALRAILTFALHPRRSGRHYYLVTLNVETLSLSDLEELRRWLRGEARPAVAGRRSVGRALERGLRRLFVRTIGLPTRSYEARSPTFLLR